MRHSLLGVLALAVVVVAAGGMANAQDFPTQPIHVVIPYVPGGGSDILARPLAPAMGERLKQPIVIDKIQQRWLAQGMVPWPTSRAEFQALIKSDLQKWEKVVRENAITVQ